jgi:hypothetical protein
MSSQPILRCSDHAPSMARRNVRNFADPYLDEGKPVILQCDERNFPHRCSVVSRDNFMTLKPQDKGGKRVFNEPPQARHRRSLSGPEHPSQQGGPGPNQPGRLARSDGWLSEKRQSEIDVPKGGPMAGIKENPARGGAGLSKPVRRVTRGRRDALAESAIQLRNRKKVPEKLGARDWVPPGALMGCRAGANQPQHEGAPADRVLEVAIGRQPHAAV